MHGVKRMSAEKRLSKRQDNEERAIAYRARSQQAFERRKAGLHDQESLNVIAKVVLENTDMATMWNFRREVLRSIHPDDAGGAGDESRDREQTARKAACTAEFALTQECLQINPKSYSVWFHREWVLKWGHCSWQWPVELKLTAKFLALDDRNFHCWTYRRSVVKLAAVPAEAELAFTTTKIEANFSNYSSWHYRSKLLPALHSTSATTSSAEGGGSGGGGDSGGGASLGTMVRSDLQLVRNAFFTAPEDSSAWFYQRWLLAQLRPGGAAAAPPEEYAALLVDEMAMVDELLELEPECKWALAAAVHLRTEQLALPASGAASGCTPEEDAKHAARLEALKRVDPMRTRYYVEVSSSQTPVVAVE